MHKWKALIPVAFSVAVLTLAAVPAQQQRADHSSNPSTLTALDYSDPTARTRYAYALDSGATTASCTGLSAPAGVRAESEAKLLRPLRWRRSPCARRSAAVFRSS
jgi:hypothetical protein